ncbi:thiamine ABC transporter ATP-binding protein [Celerinatantimonas yamalensis]|uniref:Thiamine ABC transporter ATP-binding protein n=1 Tax=Celerinatantimonas yamalensis TaxID=559956 RepID=A0ABW9G5E2_9GAMM
MLEVKALTFSRGSQQFCYNLRAQRGEVVALLGQSGCGKSTLLAMIAGFVKATGHVSWNGQSMLEQSIAERPVSSLFQSHNLFDHLSIRQNLALGLDGSLKLNKAQQGHLHQVAQQLGIADLLDRRAADLSGGQIQRAALARALLRQRPILLLDEPFSALDPVLRYDGLKLVQQLARQHQLAVLLVTHQLSDARAIAESVAFIDQGQVVQQCSPAELQTHPANEQVAHYLRIANESLFTGEDGALA